MSAKTLAISHRCSSGFNLHINNIGMNPTCSGNDDIAVTQSVAETPERLIAVRLTAASVAVVAEPTARRRSDRFPQ